MATPRKINARLIRLLYLLVEKGHISLKTCNELIKEADQQIELDGNLQRFFREMALHLTERD